MTLDEIISHNEQVAQDQANQYKGHFARPDTLLMLPPEASNEQWKAYAKETIRACYYSRLEKFEKTSKPIEGNAYDVRYFKNKEVRTREVAINDRPKEPKMTKEEFADFVRQLKKAASEGLPF